MNAQIEELKATAQQANDKTLEAIDQAMQAFEEMRQVHIKIKEHKCTGLTPSYSSIRQSAIEAIEEQVEQTETSLRRTKIQIDSLQNLTKQVLKTDANQSPQ